MLEVFDYSEVDTLEKRVFRQKEPNLTYRWVFLHDGGLNFIETSMLLIERYRAQNHWR